MHCRALSELCLDGSKTPKKAILKILLHVQPNKEQINKRWVSKVTQHELLQPVSQAL